MTLVNCATLSGGGARDGSAPLVTISFRNRRGEQLSAGEDK